MFKVLTQRRLNRLCVRGPQGIHSDATLNSHAVLTQEVSLETHSSGESKNSCEKKQEIIGTHSSSGEQFM